MENMNPFDIVVLAILVLSVFWGGMRGVIAQIATIVSWGLSWIISARYYTVVAKMLPSSETGNTIAAPIVTFVVCAIAIGIAFRFLKKMVSLAGLREFDRQAGALFGALKGALLCMLITFFAVIISDRTRDFVNNSKSGPFFVSIIGQVQDYFPESKLKDKFREIAVHNKEEKEQSDSLEAQVDSLKNYLKSRVLSQDAAEIVEEAETETAKDNVRSNPRLSSFLSNMKSIPQLVRSVATEGTRSENVNIGSAAINVSNSSDSSTYRNGAYANSGTRMSNSSPSDYYYPTDSTQGENAFDSFVTASSSLDGNASGADEGFYAGYDQSVGVATGASNAYLGGDAGNYSDGSSRSRDYSGSTSYSRGIGTGFSASSPDSYLSSRNATAYRTQEDGYYDTGSRTASSRNRRRHSRTASSVRLGSYSYSSPSGVDY